MDPVIKFVPKDLANVNAMKQIHVIDIRVFLYDSFEKSRLN